MKVKNDHFKILGGCAKKM